MKPFPLLKNLGLLAVAMATFSSSSQASNPPRLETYSAMEGANEAEQKVPKPESVQMGNPDEAQTRKLPGRKNSKHRKTSRVKIARGQPSQVGHGKGSFDPVPSEQRDLIARRLKLVEELLKKYGRAYDYRIYTAHELQMILNELESNLPAPDGEKKSMPLPPPQAIPNSWSKEKS